MFPLSGILHKWRLEETTVNLRRLTIGLHLIRGVTVWFNDWMVILLYISQQR